MLLAMVLINPGPKKMVRKIVRHYPLITPSATDQLCSARDRGVSPI
jgi:hypothetical protein